MPEKPYFVHPSAVVDGETEENGFCDPNIGKGVRIWHHAHVQAGAVIGVDTVLGHATFVGRGARIGHSCKIQNNVNVLDHVMLEDFVFCGPGMVFTNLSVPAPRAAISRREALQSTVVRRNASIGAGAVIIAGHEIGESSFVTEGSLVDRPVPAYALFAGSPARQIGWLCECGHRLNTTGRMIICPATYVRDGVTIQCERRYDFLDFQTMVPVPLAPRDPSKAGPYR